MTVERPSYIYIVTTCTASYIYIYCNHLYSGSVIDEVDNTRVYCVGEFLFSSNENVVTICVLMPILLLKTIFRLDILGKVNWIQVSVPLMNVYIAEIRLQKITALSSSS